MVSVYCLSAVTIAIFRLILFWSQSEVLSSLGPLGARRRVRTPWIHHWHMHHSAGDMAYLGHCLRSGEERDITLAFIQCDQSLRYYFLLFMHDR